MMVWLDSEWKEEEDARVSCDDGAFLRGEGIFETLLALEGQPFAFERHWARLQAGAEVFGFSLPPEREALAIAKELLVRNQLGSPGARVRLRVTKTAKHLLFTAKVEEVSGEVERVCLAPFVRNERSALTGLKAISYGENSLALAWGRRQGATEALLANTQGDWCEGTWSNVFAVEGEALLTPPLSAGCLPGVTRAIVIELARDLGLRVWEEQRPLHWLRESTEVFLTSSLRGVRPVVDIDGRTLAVGALTQRLADLLKEAEREGRPTH